jgi:UDP-N-acetylglucosamine--N-acetylmuramyl-(pentapeptide) pyrophosphoryl-undecaprenol N-acetylglucosamine transferase
MRIVFAAGGTGGHVYPALAVAGEMVKRRPDTEILFIGGTRGIERSIVDGSGYRLETIPAIGFPRKPSPAMVSFVWNLGVSIIRSRRTIRKFRPAVVMATGGYVSGPPVIAARTLGVPVVIQEQNSLPGISNRTLGRFADLVFLGFEDAEPFFRGRTVTIFTGNPVREEIGTHAREEGARAFGLDPSLPTILVFGGSQGSKAVNRAVSEASGRIAERNVQVLWQTGDREFPLLKDRDGGAGGRIRVLPYIKVMADAYAASDLVVARAGAMSIAEITACGLPAIFIPLPTAAENHQEKNARSLEKAGAAEVILERDLTPDLLAETALGILESTDRRKSMADASRRLGRKDAASIIADTILTRYGEN